nr:ComF family protein [Bacillus sp. FJAT-49736]
MLCSTYLVPTISWSIFTFTHEEKYLCRDCRKKLSVIKGEICIKCSRSLDKLDPEYVQNTTCLDCIRWEEDLKWRGILEKNISIYNYNDFFKELLSQFKFRGDYVLAKVFAKDIRKTIQSIPHDLIVPIPLSDERLLERGFCQAEALVMEAGLEPYHALSRIHTEKQSKKSRQERIHIENVFQAVENLENKSILLLDDIYTTGSTIRHAAKTLRQAGAKSVVSFTVARG